MEKSNQKTIKRIVLIGAESTGKTELSEYLAKRFNTVVVPEYAREYIENLHQDYTYKDVEHIALKQLELEEKYSQIANEVLFYDTYLIITKIWFQIAFKEVPEWINQRIKNSKIDLFLLCNNDIPWIPDSVRENGGEMRDELFKIYQHELIDYGFNYKIISGEGDERLNKALEVVSDIVNKKNSENG